MKINTKTGEEIRELYYCPECKKEYTEPSFDFCMECVPTKRLKRKEDDKS